jgi:hypothetical protein
MDEAGESKRDQATRALTNFLGTYPYHHRDTPRLVVALIVDAAKEEIRAELAERDEEDRWHELTEQDAEDRWHEMRNIKLFDGPQSRAFHEEYRALKAKREAAGKETD